MSIVEQLFELRDEKYAEFQVKLTPGVLLENVIGVRIPLARKLGKELYKSGEYKKFLHDLPHKYYDENILHSIILSEIKNYEECIEEIERFLPYVDNWAVCDIISPKVLKKHLDSVIDLIRKWCTSELTYTLRFGMEMLMSFYLDEAFKPEYLEIPAQVKSDEYYVNMMIAWFFATALAKQWNFTIPYIENKRLDDWTHKKSIQKAIESYRITSEQKDYLRTLK